MTTIEIGLLFDVFTLMSSLNHLCLLSIKEHASPFSLWNPFPFCLHNCPHVQGLISFNENQFLKLKYGATFAMSKLSLKMKFKYHYCKLNHRTTCTWLGFSHNYKVHSKKKNKNFKIRHFHRLSNTCLTGHLCQCGDTPLRVVSCFRVYYKQHASYI